MKQLIKFIAITSLMFVACKSDNDTDVFNEQSTVTIDWNKTPDGIISDLIDTTLYIALETHADGLFGVMDKLYFTKDRIYVADMTNRTNILAFDRNNGIFLFPVGRQGGGPEEYTRLENFTADDENIYLFDNVNEKVLIYDKNNKFVKKASCPFEVADLAKTKKGYLLSLNYFYNDGTLNGKPKLLTVDKNFKNPKEVFLIDNNYSILHKKANLPTNQNKISYHVYGMDDIVVFDKENPDRYKSYLLDFGDRKLPLEKRFDYQSYTTLKNDFIRSAFVMDKYIVGAVGSSEAFVFDMTNGKLYKNFELKEGADFKPILPKGRTLQERLSPIIRTVYQNDVITEISGKFYKRMIENGLYNKFPEDTHSHLMADPENVALIIKRFKK